ncbi:MAG: DUF5340 family protein [Pseudanabaenaceae cyanobacterium]
MNPIPVPSPIHYELLLQLLERQTLPALEAAQQDAQHGKAAAELLPDVQQALVLVRKAASIQRQLEADCAYRGLPVTYRWSLNETEPTLTWEPVVPPKENSPGPGQSLDAPTRENFSRDGEPNP